MAEFLRMLMADAQQAQKESAPHEEYTVDSFPRYRETDIVLKYTVRVALRGITPPIWRKVIVPSNISLRLFGDLILELMGWMGAHLNQFRKGDSYYAPAYQREGELTPLFGRFRNYNQEDFALGEILCEKGDTMVWEYDFGDSWIHEIILESCQSYKKEEIPVIALLDGENACPPEDCNGIWGYRKMLKALEKPRSKAAREYKEWLGYNFDPTEFDLDETRGLLAEIVD